MVIKNNKFDKNVHHILEEIHRMNERMIQDNIGNIIKKQQEIQENIQTLMKSFEKVLCIQPQIETINPIEGNVDIIDKKLEENMIEVVD
jgi:hypothetical protein